MWFSLGENHDKACRSPDFLRRSTGREQLCATFFTESRISSVVPPTSTGNPGSGYTHCETAKRHHSEPEKSAGASPLGTRFSCCIPPFSRFWFSSGQGQIVCLF